MWWHLLDSCMLHAILKLSSFAIYYGCWFNEVVLKVYELVHFKNIG